MLSSKYIQKMMRFNDQYGPPEDTFSPGWHADQARNGPDHPLDPMIPSNADDAHAKVVRVILGEVEDSATGDVRIVQYKSTEERDADPLRIKREGESVLGVQENIESAQEASHVSGISRMIEMQLAFGSGNEKHMNPRDLHIERMEEERRWAQMTPEDLDAICRRLGFPNGYADLEPKTE